MEITVDCGCVVCTETRSVGYGTTTIKHCSLHAAAPDMLDVLRSVNSELFGKNERERNLLRRVDKIVSSFA